MKRILMFSILLIVFLTACGQKSSKEEAKTDTLELINDPSVMKIGETLTIGNLSFQHRPHYNVLDHTSNNAALRSMDGVNVIATVAPIQYSMTIDEFIEYVVSDLGEGYELLEESNLDINGTSWKHKTISYHYQTDKYHHTILTTTKNGNFYVFSYVGPEKKKNDFKNDRMLMISSIRIDMPEDGQGNVSDKDTDISMTTDEILIVCKSLYENDFKRLEDFNIADTQKLAMILCARYLDMQERIDLNAIGALNPQIKSNLESNNKKEFINQALMMHDYILFAVDSAEIRDGVLTFNGAYSFEIDDSSATNISIIYMTFTYKWQDKSWVFVGHKEAKPETAGKPNRLLELYIMRDETQAAFGVNNVINLFDFEEPSYRETLAEQYRNN